MITIILGAGASNGCVQKQDGATPLGIDPPLSKQLFDNIPEFRKILSAYDRAKQLVYNIRISLRESNSTSLEDELDSYAAKGQYLSEMVAIKFYLRDLFQKVSDDYLSKIIGTDNYSSLVHFLNKEVMEPVTFITFNYDTLLEQSIEEITQRRYKKMQDYMSSKYPILKLHGSCNWCRLLFDWDLQESPYEYFSSSGTEPNNPIEVGEQHQESYPAIGLPLTTKTKESFECPEEMLNQAIETMQHTTKLILIGWKGREDHFNRLVLSRLNKDASIQIISQSTASAKKIGEHLTGYNELRSFRSRIQYPGVSGFSGYVVSSEMREFLTPAVVSALGT